MKKFRKLATVVTALLCLCFAVSSMTGCFVKKQQPIDEEMEKKLAEVDFGAGLDYKGKLKILIPNLPDHEDVVKAFISDFTQKYQNIEVTYQGLPNLVAQVGNDHSAAVTTGKYGDMPDIIWTANEDLPGLANIGALMPLDFFDKKDEAWDTSALVPSMVEDSYFDDHMYMMPRDYNQIAMLYNKKMFRQAKEDGVTVGGAPIKNPGEYVDSQGNARAMTKQEFTETAYAIANWMHSTDRTNNNDKSYKSGYAVEFKGTWLSFLSAVAKNYGADIFGEDGKCTVDSAEMVEMCTDLATLKHDGVLYTASQNGYDYFASEFAAMCFESRACLTAVTEPNEARKGVYEELAVAPMPCLGDEDKYAVAAGCSGYAMYRNTTHPTEAWLFLKNLVRTDAQDSFCRSGNGVPVLQSLLDDEDAVWRNIRTENPDRFALLDENFDHDAFVYARDRAETITFRERVSAENYGDACSRIRTVFGAIFGLKLPEDDKGNVDEAKTKDVIEKTLKQYRRTINTNLHL